MSREKIENDVQSAWTVLKRAALAKSPLDALADMLDPKLDANGKRIDEPKKNPAIDTVAEEVYELEIIDGKATLRDGSGDIVGSNMDPVEARRLRERLLRGDRR